MSRKYAIKRIYSSIFAIEDVTDGQLRTDLFGNVVGGFNEMIPYLFINPTLAQTKIKGAHYVFTLTPTATDAIGDVHELIKFLGNSTDDSLDAKGFTISDLSDLRAKIQSFFPSNPFIRQRIYAQEGYTLEDYYRFMQGSAKEIANAAKDPDSILGYLYEGITDIKEEE